jgi:hypothetical protein
MPKAETTAAVAAAVVAKAMAIGTAMAAATTTERGWVNVARGKQATAKVKRRRSSTQYNNKPTTKWG